ncbi:MAG: hypothetical protein AAF197_10005, partial [Pseudomonadota bacterium]
EEALPRLMADLDASIGKKEAQGGSLSAEFIPEIQQCSSSSQQPPAWPSTLQTTTLLTAVNFDYSPFPSLVRYSSQLPGLRTDMYNPWPETNGAWNLYSARLKSDTGYSAFYSDQTLNTCKQNLPGPPVANWMSIDQCECKASLPPGTSLNPRSDENLLVMMCPLTPLTMNPSNPQVFWTWYGEQTGAPQVFMQSDSSAKSGTGLNLADYYSWEPNATVDQTIFETPAGCIGKPKIKVPPQCHNCHLPTNSELKGGEAIDWHIPYHLHMDEVTMTTQ